MFLGEGGGFFQHLKCNFYLKCSKKAGFVTMYQILLSKIVAYIYYFRSLVPRLSHSLRTILVTSRNRSALVPGKLMYLAQIHPWVLGCYFRKLMPAGLRPKDNDWPNQYSSSQTICLFLKILYDQSKCL